LCSFGFVYSLFGALCTLQFGDTKREVISIFLGGDLYKDRVGDPKYLEKVSGKFSTFSSV
jgi:hypothetical protein